MARYIDADAFLEENEGAENSGWTLRELVDMFPTADVQEVKHGHWECIDHERLFFQCSNCHSFSDFQSRFCPHCGLKMVKEVE